MFTSVHSLDESTSLFIKLRELQRIAWYDQACYDDKLIPVCTFKAAASLNWIKIILSGFLVTLNADSIKKIGLRK